MAILDWLLDSDPAIRCQVLRAAAEPGGLAARLLSQELAEGDRAFALFEPESFVRGVAGNVVQERVAAELVKAALAGPILDGFDQRATDAATAHVGINPPPFDEGARLFIDAVGEWAYAGFDHAAQSVASGALRDEGDLIGVTKDLLGALGEVVGVFVRPEGDAHAGVLGGIARLESSDSHG